MYSFNGAMNVVFDYVSMEVYMYKTELIGHIVHADEHLDHNDLAVMQAT